uniref:Uncharacterized protein n=1 Tax=Knipowitschia caucasica TaxID=637954 RepID=A0AAV2L5U8_KNICA
MWSEDEDGDGLLWYAIRSGGESAIPEEERSVECADCIVGVPGKFTTEVRIRGGDDGGLRGLVIATLVETSTLGEFDDRIDESI